ncbi:MAG: malonyl-ACP O-methyltransferase BioC [Steroidobacterales bacterium]
MSRRDASGEFALDGRSARRSFERASAHYDESAVLQAQVRAQLLERLDFTALIPRVVLDAGAGTGHASRALKVRYPRARVIAVDYALGMLREARAQRAWLRPFDRVCADACRLPFADASVDLVLSNFLVHWCDPAALFREFRRVLAPRGLLTFTSLGPDTLRELHAAWGSVDAAIRVHRFFDMHDLGDELVRAGFAAPVLDVERYTLQYRDLRALLADLRANGARNAMWDRPRGLTGRRRFAAVEAAYEAYRQQGRLPATFEVVFGQAWTPAAGAGDEPRQTGISLAELRAKLPGKMRK